MKMKTGKIIITLAIIGGGLFYAGISSGQSSGFRYGGHFGLGASRILKIDSVSVDQKLSFNAGLAASYQFNNFLALDLNVLLVSKGAKTSGEITDGTDFWGNPKTYDYDGIYRLVYGEVPLILKVSIGGGNFYLQGFGGPSMNFNLISTESRTYKDSKYNSENGYEDRPMNNLEVVEFSFVYGGALAVEYNEQVFFLDLRINNALSSFRKIENEDGYNRYYSVGIGYLFTP